MGTAVKGRKAEAFAEFAKSSGWDVEISHDAGDKTTVVAKRSDEQISISWKGEACLNETSYKNGSYERKLRNASAARQKMAEDGSGKPPKVAPKPNGGSRRKAKPEPVKSVPKIPRRVPWSEEATDAEILKAVTGKVIVWRNVLAGRYEEARVMAKKDQRHLRIDVNRKLERCLTFCEADMERPEIPGGPFRSVRLSAIVKVK